MKLPRHECGLHLEHNANRNVYETIAEYVEKLGRDEDFYNWQSPEHRSRSIETNELWTLQWYPDTPVGFYAVAAPTLDELLTFAHSLEEDVLKRTVL